jgi:hypothetical protein
MCSARQQLRVGGVAESLPSDEGARPAQRVALLAADGSVDVETGDDVPDAARGEAEDGNGSTKCLRPVWRQLPLGDDGGEGTTNPETTRFLCSLIKMLTKQK